MAITGQSSLDYKRQIEESLNDESQVRAFPTTASKLIEACKSEDVRVQEIIQLIECDPSIASKVLSLANSPLYGANRPISTIGHSVVVLGFQTVSRVAVSIATGQLFLEGDAGTEGFRKRVFNQSIGCAAASRVFAKRQAGVNPDESFLVGIMQDVGQLVFLDVLSTDYIGAIGDENDATIEVEEVHFGINHALLGKTCGSIWGLPASINEAISNHHGDPETVTDPLSRVAIVGGYFARKWQLGFGRPYSEVLVELESQFSEQELDDLESECRDVYAAVNDICSI